MCVCVCLCLYVSARVCVCVLFKNLAHMHASILRSPQSSQRPNMHQVCSSNTHTHTRIHTHTHTDLFQKASRQLLVQLLLRGLLRLLHPGTRRGRRGGNIQCFLTLWKLLSLDLQGHHSIHVPSRRSVHHHALYAHVCVCARLCVCVCVLSQEVTQSLHT